MSLLYRLCTEARFSAWHQQKQHGMRSAWGAADVLEHTYPHMQSCRDTLISSSRIILAGMAAQGGSKGQAWHGIGMMAMEL